MIEKRAEFEVEGQKLVGTLCFPEGRGPFPAALFLHGRASSRKNKIPILRKLAGVGIVGFAFDFRGCGESEGEFAASRLGERLKDTQAALKFLVNWKIIDSGRVGLYGSSMGGYLAALVSPRGIKSLVLRAPASYKGKREELGVGNSASIEAIRKFRGSLLLIQGEYDEVIPREVIRAYYENAVLAREKRLYVIKGATHRLSNPAWRVELEEQVCHWFKKTLK